MQGFVLRSNSAAPLTIIDVGAHFGEWSGHLLQQARTVGLQPTLHVFEPSRFTFDRLAETLAGTEGVHLSRLGVSSRSGTAVLHKPREGAGSSSLHQGWPCETASEEVSLTTLDEYCADARWVHARRYLRDAFTFTFADALGYQLGKVTPRGIEFYEAWHPELESFKEGNYLLVRPEVRRGMQAVTWWGP